MHPRTKSQLDSFIKEPSHALALSGEAGSGKRTLGQHIAAEVLGIEMRALEQYAYFKQLDGSAKGGIDAVRELRAFLSLKVPGSRPFKRAILLENLDSLRHEAQNALLKTIEEPPADTLIIVTYSLPSMVLPTLHSRMQMVSILPISFEAAKEFLSSDFNQKLIKQSYYMSGGLPGVLYSLLTNQESHPLIQAIDEAKHILRMSRFERLAYVDKVLKNKKTPVDTLLDGLYRLISAGYRLSLEKASQSEQKAYSVRLKVVEQAIKDSQSNVQAKLVLSRLFTEL